MYDAGDDTMRFEKQSFGLVLRAGRERQEISLAQLSAETKVSPQIWIALEENDFSRWPTRIYARSLMREYAKRVGLDPEELVDEFCRLFPQGDRRGESLLRERAAFDGHQLDWHPELLPAHGKPGRRTGDRAIEAPLQWHGGRTSAAWVVAAALDASIVLVVSKLVAVVFGVHFWPLLGLVALAYHAMSMMGMGKSVGAVAGDRYSPSLGLPSGLTSPAGGRERSVPLG
jgi:hypothetical protein